MFHHIHMYARSYKELLVWQKSIELVASIYKVTRSLPKDELYGLISQMRRAAISVASNIAEGKKRGTRKDFRRFLSIADGSAAELETQLIISKREFTDLDFSKSEVLLIEVQKMLLSLMLTLRKKNMPTPNNCNSAG